MAICDVCNGEMTVVHECKPHTLIYSSGEKLAALVYSNDYRDDDHYCHDCNCALGAYHHPGCDMEICPKCSGQLISCDCGWTGEVEVIETSEPQPEITAAPEPETRPASLFDKDEMAALRAQLADVLNSAQILEEMAERLTARIRGDLAEIGNPIRLAVGDRLLVTYDCQDAIARNNPRYAIEIMEKYWPHMAEVTLREFSESGDFVTIQLRGQIAFRIPLDIARKMRGEWLLNAESDANGGTSND